jgi:serine/threonine protein kinase
LQKVERCAAVGSMEVRNHRMTLAVSRRAPGGEPRFRFLRLLAAGRSGKVHLAEHTALGTRVAIKVMHRSSAEGAESAAVLQRDAEKLVRLVHPNVVRLLEWGQTLDGRAYFVMEHLVGTTLADLLTARGRLRVAEAVDVARQVLAGLGALHRAGLAHGSVRPEHVFVCRSAGARRCVAKLIDGGLAGLGGGGRGRGVRGDLRATARVVRDAVAGSPPELEGVLRKALGADGFATAREFAAALNGVAVGPARRRLLGMSRRQEVIVAVNVIISGVALSLLLAQLVAGALR